VTGTMTAPVEVLEMFNVKSLFPLVGGHEGAGVVTKVGEQVTDVAVGDHVALSFVPTCGVCFWCASGRQNLCDQGAATLAGPSISDGTWRYHLDGEPIEQDGASSVQFAEKVVCHHSSVIKIETALFPARGRAHQLRSFHRLRLGSDERWHQRR